MAKFDDRRLLQDSDDEDVEEEIDAQIEQLLSAKRTVKNIDAASAANMMNPANKKPDSPAGIIFAVIPGHYIGGVI